MLKYVLIASVLIALVLSSCTAFKAHQIKKWCNSTIHDSAYTEVTHILDTTFVQIPFAELTFDTTDTRLPYDITIEHKESKGSLNGSFSIKHQKVSFECNVQPYIDTVAFLRNHIKTFQSKIETKYIDCDKKHHTGWDSFCNYHTIITWCLFIIAVLIWVFKKL